MKNIKTIFTASVFADDRDLTITATRETMAFQSKKRYRVYIDVTGCFDQGGIMRYAYADFDTARECNNYALITSASWLNKRT